MQQNMRGRQQQLSVIICLGSSVLLMNGRKCSAHVQWMRIHSLFAQQSSTHKTLYPAAVQYNTHHNVSTLKILRVTKQKREELLPLLGTRLGLGLGFGFGFGFGFKY